MVKGRRGGGGGAPVEDDGLWSEQLEPAPGTLRAHYVIPSTFYVFVIFHDKRLNRNP